MRTNHLYSRCLFFFLCLFLLFNACVPVNSTFESARMLHKDQVEIKGSYSNYVYQDNGENNVSNNNFGAGLGYGINEKWNIKTRYEYIKLPGEAHPAHYIDLMPKYSFVATKLAAALPVGCYFGDEVEPTYVISPKIIGTLPFDNKLEFTCAIKTDIFLEKDSDIPIGINLGAGLSTNLNIWAIRPETGLMLNTSGNDRSFTFGVGASYNFGSANKHVIKDPKW